jgi:hypothetical protein
MSIINIKISTDIMKQINEQSQRFPPTKIIQAFGDLKIITLVLKPTVFVLPLLLLTGTVTGSNMTAANVKPNITI